MKPILSTVMQSALVAALLIPAQGAVPPQLTGTWQNGTVSGLQYWDSTERKWEGGGGRGQVLEIDANGRFKQHTYFKNYSYGWTTEIFSTFEGNVRVEGSTIVMEPTAAKYRSRDNRLPKNNFDRPATPDELIQTRTSKPFTIKMDAQGRTVLSIGGAEYYRPSDR